MLNGPPYGGHVARGQASTWVRGAPCTAQPPQRVCLESVGTGRPDGPGGTPETASICSWFTPACAPRVPPAYSRPDGELVSPPPRLAAGSALPSHTSPSGAPSRARRFSPISFVGAVALPRGDGELGASCPGGSVSSGRELMVVASTGGVGSPGGTDVLAGKGQGGRVAFIVGSGRRGSKLFGALAAIVRHVPHAVRGRASRARVGQHAVPRKRGSWCLARIGNGLHAPPARSHKDHALHPLT